MSTAIISLYRKKIMLYGSFTFQSAVVFYLTSNNKKRDFTRLVEMIKSLYIEDNVILFGYIKDDLPHAYNIASLFVGPSLYENFPLPLLETMACGIPVITSNAGAIPETYGGAVILVEPLGIEGFAAAIDQVLSSDQSGEDLKQKGQEKAKMYSRKRCALETLKIYEDIYNSSLALTTRDKL